MFRFFVAFLILLALVSCRDAKVTPTATLSAPPKIIQTPSRAPSTDSLSETATRIMPVATFTPLSTSTPSPSPTVLPTFSVSLLTAQDFGGDRNPFTGELMAETGQLDRRPIAVKISNAPPSYTRPQSGLESADIVFEHVTEGSITRFTAIFYGKVPERVGPIRSARLIDLELPIMYDAALAYSGSSIGVARKLFNSPFASRILRTNTNGYYRTGEDKPYEHTLYARPEDLWDSLSSRAENHPPNVENHMAFTSESPPGGISNGGVSLEYPNFSEIEWRYDEDSGRYLRWVDLEIHREAITGNQLSAANVVLLSVEHRLDSAICEYQVGNQCRAYSTEILLNGTGTAYLLRDGYLYEASWRRTQPDHMLTLSDAQDNQLPFQIGNTWFQVIPSDYADSISFLDSD